MTTLYIIGNGFDIFHELPTQYSDYKIFLTQLFPPLLEEYESLPFLTGSPNDGSRWSDIEYSLKLDYETFIEDALQSYPLNLSQGGSVWHDASTYIENATVFIENFTMTFFYTWLNSINLNMARNEVIFEPNAKFVTFNYTGLLERKYGIKEADVLHIHGTCKNISEENLDFVNNILNHVDPDAEDYFELEKEILRQREDARRINREIQFGSPDNDSKNLRKRLAEKYEKDDYYGAWIEPCIWSLETFCEFAGKSLTANYSNLNNFIDCKAGKVVDSVCVFGHCFDGIDKPYYEDILIPRFKDLQWAFVIYDQVGETKAREFCSENGIYDFRIICDRGLTKLDLRRG